MNIFDKLSKNVGDLAKSRFKNSTPIQKLAIPKVLEGKNCLIIAGTGFGKTESIMLPLLDKLSSTEHKPISLLYITPLKALDRNMFERLIWWCNKLNIEISVRHGDTPQRERTLQSHFPPNIMISTPETLQALLTGKRLREHLKNVKYIVVDEVHELAGSKRGIQLSLGLERLKQLCGDPQIVVLSATVENPKNVGKFIFGNKKFEIIKTTDTKQMNIRVINPLPTKDDKDLAEKIFIGDKVAARIRTMYELMNQYKSVLMFTNTRETAEVLSSRLRILDKKFPHEVHHSSLSKETRIQSEKKFKEEKLKAIIATSSLQLGIDIGSIDLVIQYLSPRTVTQFAQRAGRSGHSILKESKGIIITGEGDDLFESSVVAKRTINGELEPQPQYKKCLDVLSHQIVGLANDEYKIDIKKAYKIIKNANPYKNLSYEEFEDLLKFLNSMKLLWYDDGIKRGMKGLKYYFENLSTIPDSKSYLIIDMATNQPIGRLDDAFIAEHSETGSSFIVNGQAWRVISVDGGKVFVEPQAGIESSIPSWQGEQIPVSFDVAQDVGKLRRKIYTLLNKPDKEIINYIQKNYPVDKNTAKSMLDIMKKQSKFILPDQKTIVLEKYSDYTIMNCCFGSLVNETLSRFLTAMISAETGKVTQSKVDPYRIIFKGVNIEEIKNTIFKYKAEDLKPILFQTLSNTSLFKHRFIQVAKRFSIITRGSSFEKISTQRLVNSYKDTPVFKETFNELFVEKLDIERSEDVLEKIQSKEIKVKISEKKISPLGAYGLEYELRNVTVSGRPTHEIFRFFKKRLLNTKVKIICLTCGGYAVTYKVKDVSDTPRCPKCASRLLACVNPYITEAQGIVKKWLKGKDLTGDEENKLKRIKDSADFVINDGKRAIMVLSGRGVGPATTSFILKKRNINEEELLKNILEAEKQWIKNKKYWSD